MPLWPGTAGSWPKASRVPSSPGTCSPSTRPITPGCVDWCHLRSPCVGSKACGREFRPLSTTSSTPWPTGDPDAPTDLVATFAFPLPFTVVCELLGVPEGERASLGHGLVAMLVPTPTQAEYVRAKEASDAVVSQLRRLVVAKHDAPGDDLVSGPDRGSGRGRATGHRGTALDHLPAHRGRSRHHHDVHRQRGRRPPRPPRSARTAASRSGPDTGGGGGTAPIRRPGAPLDLPVRRRTGRDRRPPRFPAGAQIIVCLAAANHDPCRFADPERLDLERAEGRHLAFGHGIHHCLGAPLARLEGQLALGSLIRRFPRLRLAGPRTALHWGHGDGLVLRGLSDLPVIPGPALPR